MVTRAPTPRGMLRPFPLHPVAESTMLVNPQRRPARLASRPFAIDQPTLLQFVLLSMLLHVLLIVLFGNPTGGARRNEGWPGPLDVTLRRLSPEAGPSFRLAPGTAPAQRAPLQAPRRLERSAPEEIDQRLTPPAAAPAKIERVAPPQSERQLAPAAVVPNRAVPAAPAAAIERVAPPQIEREVVPPVELPQRAVPAAPAAVIERVAPPRVEREVAPPVELPNRALPAAPAAPIERVAPPQIEREVVPPVELPQRAVPAAPVAPIERVAPPQIEREVVPPVELPQRAVPAAPTAPLERVAPPQIEREVAPPVELPPRAVPAAPPVERVAPAVAPARPQALPAAPVPPSRFGAPDADEEIFKPRRDVGATPSEAPRIDLDAARKKAAREIAREGSGSRGVFTVPSPPLPEKKSKEAIAMEKAVKPDCRTAYANIGLLAVPALVASAIAADGSCRW